jgi:hypothetical protein
VVPTAHEILLQISEVLPEASERACAQLYLVYHLRTKRKNAKAPNAL